MTSRVLVRSKQSEGKKTFPVDKMEVIRLTKGYVALVDDDDWEWLSERAWHAKVDKRGVVYAAHTSGSSTILMHRFILGLKAGDRRRSDHKNHDTLDNRRENLRITDASGNGANRKPNKNVKFKGVTKRNNKWQAKIKVNGKQIFLGLYDDPKDAAKVYDTAAVENFGEFACLNFKKIVR